MLRIILVSFVAISCKVAKFGFSGGQQGASSDAQTQSSSSVVTSSSGLPDAAIEVEQSGVVGQSVLINQPVTIRPTSSTVDTGLGIDTNCVNKGIVKAVYTVDLDTKSVERKSSDCTSLEIPYTFTSEGQHIVMLQVFTPDNKTASASMIVYVVTETTSTTTMQPSFTIVAVPLFSPAKQVVNFSSVCHLSSGSVSWDFGDLQSAVGDSTTHSYDGAGQFVVSAICSGGSTNLKASTTVVVQSSLPSSSPSALPKPSPSPSASATNTPTQNNPIQNNPTQNSGH